MMESMQCTGPWAGSFLMFFWIAVLFAVVFVGRWLLVTRKRDPSIPESALEAVDRRYANGEIDEETHKRMKHNIES